MCNELRHVSGLYWLEAHVSIYEPYFKPLCPTLASKPIMSILFLQLTVGARYLVPFLHVTMQI